MRRVDLHTNINYISVCSGIGGLDLGLKRAIPRARCVLYIEVEAYACAVLAKRMEEGWIDPAPIWSDLKTFSRVAHIFRGRVDGLIGGYPCQPFSCAGTRGGARDPRHLFPYILGIIKAVQPVFCFFENVAGHLSLGFPDVYRSLRSLGYRVEAGLFTAAEVGAPHRRQRLFIMAHGNAASGRTVNAVQSGWIPTSDDRRAMADASNRQLPQPGRGAQGRDGTGSAGEVLAHAARDGRTGSQREAGSGRGICQAGDQLADAEGFSGGLQLQSGQSQADPESVGSGEAVADSASSRCADSRQHGSRLPSLSARPEQCGEPVADASRLSDQRWREFGKLAGAERTEQAETDQRERDGDTADNSCAGLGDSESERRGRELEGGRTGSGGAGPAGTDRDVGDSGRSGLAKRQFTEDIGGTVRHEGQAVISSSDFRLPDWPPGPGDIEGWRWVLERYPGLAPAVAEAQPDLRRVANGVLPAGLVGRRHRTDRLRALGNAVVPACAELAFRALYERIKDE